MEPRVAGGVGPPVLDGCSSFFDVWSKRRLLRTNWRTEAVRLRLNIDGGSVQSFYAAGTEGKGAIVGLTIEKPPLTRICYESDTIF